MNGIPVHDDGAVRPEVENFPAFENVYFRQWCGTTTQDILAVPIVKLGIDYPWKVGVSKGV